MTLSNQLVRRALAFAAMAIATGLGFAPAAAQTELKIGYMKHPVQDASIDIMESWAKANGVKITRVAMPYEIFMEKVTATLTSGGDQFDVIWHNDDWGQLWKGWVDTTDDIPAMDKVFKRTVDVAFLNDEKRPTVVPMVHTTGILMYRTDLVQPNEVPKTLDELVTTAKRLQAEKKVKWGYVGGMGFNHSWFTWFWANWASGCDVFEPPFERDAAALAKAGWKPMLDSPCQQKVVEYWWDAINTHKISPPGMPAYTRNDANAIFQAGDAAFTIADSTLLGLFNDPKQSKAAGKVAIAPFPWGPGRTQGWAWNDIWGWGIPKGSPAEKKALAKKMLNAMLLDEEGQLQLWKKAGGAPPNMTIWPKLAESDPVFRQTKEYILDAPQVIAGALYTPKWPAIHKAYSDAVIEAINGKREAIPDVLKAHAPKVHQAAVE